MVEAVSGHKETPETEAETAQTACLQVWRPGVPALAAFPLCPRWGERERERASWCLSPTLSRH